ncbi:hypothetical protein P9Z80_13675 [Bacillus cereus]|nr:hypothetical protein [Bacillus cereus]MEC3260900.1 hypothetical protein [Bacillus cereus]
MKLNKKTLGIALIVAILGSACSKNVVQDTQIQQDTKQEEKVNEPFYIKPPKESSLNKELRIKLGNYGGYHGKHNEYFGKMVNDLAKGNKTEQQVKDEINKLDLWEEPGQQPEGVSWGVADVFAKVIKTSSNSYSEIDKLIYKEWNGKYFEVAIYWDEKAKKNTVAMLGVRFMYQ